MSLVPIGPRDSPPRGGGGILNAVSSRTEDEKEGFLKKKNTESPTSWTTKKGRPGLEGHENVAAGRPSGPLRRRQTRVLGNGAHLPRQGSPTLCTAPAYQHGAENSRHARSRPWQTRIAAFGQSAHEKKRGGTPYLNVPAEKTGTSAPPRGISRPQKSAGLPAYPPAFLNPKTAFRRDPQPLPVDRLAIQATRVGWSRGVSWLDQPMLGCVAVLVTSPLL